MISVATLYQASLDADAAWQAAIVAAYGNREAAAARYDERGTATPELAALFAAKVSTYDAFRSAAFAHARAAA